MNFFNYTKFIDDSFNEQFSRYVANPHNFERSGIGVLKTSLDFGRQTGKTRSLVEMVARDCARGVFTYYVGHTRDAVEKFRLDVLKHRSVGESLSVATKRTNFRQAYGNLTQSHQAINLIFDECGLSHIEENEFVRSVLEQMARHEKLHLFPFIHVIRIGM